MKGFFKVPQKERWIVERWGKFQFVAEPGLNFTLPIGFSIKEKHLISEQKLPLFAEPTEMAFACGASGTPVDMLAFVQIIDPYKASYAVDNWKESAAALIESKVRAVFMQLTEQKARELAKNILNTDAFDVDALNELKESLAEYGVQLNKVIFKDIRLSKEAQEARAAPYRRQKELEASKLESQVTAQEGMGAYLASLALAEGLTLEQVQEKNRSPRRSKQARDVALSLTQDSMKLKAGALRKTTIDVPQGTTLESLVTLLGEALSGKGSRGGSDDSSKESSSKEKDKNKKYNRFKDADEAEKWIEDWAAGKDV